MLPACEACTISVLYSSVYAIEKLILFENFEIVFFFFFFYFRWVICQESADQLGEFGTRDFCIIGLKSLCKYKYLKINFDIILNYFSS